MVLVVLAGGYFVLSGKQTTTPTSPVTPMQSEATDGAMVQEEMKTITVSLEAAKDSSESGTATLTEEAGKVTVVLSLTGGPTTTPQPAHIHVGKCPEVGVVKYPLTNVVDGKSTTTLDVTLSKLLGELPLGINVHKSVPEVKVYTACGDITK